MRAVNLIPDDQRERTTGFANRSGGAAYVILGALGALALMIALYGIARHQVSSKESEASRIESEAAQVQAQATRLAPYKTFIGMREGREDAVRELVDTRFDWAHTLSEFGRVLPAGTAITTLEGCVTPPTSSSSGGSEGCASSSSSSSSSSKGASTVTSATPAGSVPKFTVGGCAVSQAAVARAIADLRLIDGVAKAELTSSSGGGGGSGGSGGCSGKLVSFGAKVEFQPLPSAPSASSSSSSSSAAAVPASHTSGSATSGSGSSGAPE